LAIKEILDRIDDKSLGDNEFKSQLKELDGEILSLRLPDKKIFLDKIENTTILMEIRNEKREIVRTTEIQPMTVISESEVLQTIPFSMIRKYVTKKNIETLLSSE
jgi:hypothetical protein